MVGNCPCVFMHCWSFSSLALLQWQSWNGRFDHYVNFKEVHMFFISELMIRRNEMAWQVFLCWLSFVTGSWSRTKSLMNIAPVLWNVKSYIKLHLFQNSMMNCMSLICSVVLYNLPIDFYWRCMVVCCFIQNITLIPFSFPWSWLRNRQSLSFLPESFLLSLQTPLQPDGPLPLIWPEAHSDCSSSRKKKKKKWKCTFQLKKKK